MRNVIAVQAASALRNSPKGGGTEVAAARGDGFVGDELVCADAHVNSVGGHAFACGGDGACDMTHSRHGRGPVDVGTGSSSCRNAQVGICGGAEMRPTSTAGNPSISMPAPQCERCL